MEKKSIFLIIISFFIVSCSTAGVKDIQFTQFEKSIPVNKSFDDVWGFILEWSALNSFPIEDTDKNDGIIKLSGSGTVSQSFFQAPILQGEGAKLDESLVSCGKATGNIGFYQGKFTDLKLSGVIILRSVNDQTRVTVNFSGNAGVEVRNGFGVVSSSRNTCASKGVFEKRLFRDLRSFSES